MAGRGATSASPAGTIPPPPGCGELPGARRGPRDRPRPPPPGTAGPVEHHGL